MKREGLSVYRQAHKSANLFSDEIEVEHLLPFSSTLDDSMSNKVVCYREANRVKGRGHLEALDLLQTDMFGRISLRDPSAAWWQEVALPSKCDGDV